MHNVFVSQEQEPVCKNVFLQVYGECLNWSFLQLSVSLLENTQFLRIILKDTFKKTTVFWRHQGTTWPVTHIYPLLSLEHDPKSKYCLNKAGSDSLTTNE